MTLQNRFLTHRLLKLIGSVCLAMTLSGCNDDASQDSAAKAPVRPQSLQFADTSNLTRVLISTSKGDIEVGLDAERAPVTVKNFLSYVDSGQYDGTIFHRVIRGFMIQGGGFTEDYQRKPTQDPIQNEADNGLRNEKYTIAMARTGEPHSATAQFFINSSNNDFLNHTSKSFRGWGYAVFGIVTKGFDVVDSIERVNTGSNGPFRQDAPQEQVVIRSVKRVK